LAVTEPEVQLFLVTVQFSPVIFQFGKPDLEALDSMPPSSPSKWDVRLFLWRWQMKTMMTNDDGEDNSKDNHQGKGDGAGMKTRTSLTPR
jgi:hypothetical protein